MKLLWIDLETTGLDPRRHGIIELAWILTSYENGEFKELKNFTCLVDPGDVAWSSRALVMHTASNLIEEWFLTVETGHAFNKFDYLAASIKQDVSPYVEEGENLRLAGRNVAFEAGFLGEYMPSLFDDFLHYRRFDVSTLLALDADLEQLVNHPYTHRALDDIKHDLEFARCFAENFNQ